MANFISKTFLKRKTRRIRIKRYVINALFNLDFINKQYKDITFGTKNIKNEKKKKILKYNYCYFIDYRKLKNKSKTNNIP